MKEEADEERKKGTGKGFLVILIAIILLFLFSVYWFIPFGTFEFSTGPTNYNFSESADSELQYTSNMRFASPEISYKISNCPLQREDDMEEAFRLMQEQTVLSFYPAEDEEEISVTCEEDVIAEGNFFIAGEGGPTNGSVSGNFSVVTHGKILLLRDSDCERPNVATHELLHVLGFKHSQNPKNIMYNVTNCRQMISEDIINFLNKVYSFPAEPDLVFESADALMRGRYLDSNFSIRNNGIVSSGEAKVIIFADEKKIKEINLDALSEGEGMKILLTGILINQLNVNEVKFVIESDFSELNKANNEISMEIKK